MVYGPRFSKTDFQGGKNILASEHLEYVKGGATLDHTEFDTGYNEVGLLAMRDKSSGKFVPFDAETYDIGTHDTPSIINVDFHNDHGQDLIAGEVIVRGTVYEAKLPQEVPTEFKQAAPLIQYANH